MRTGFRVQNKGLVLDPVAHAYAYPSLENVVGADGLKDTGLGIYGVVTIECVLKQCILCRASTFKS